jgi:hypothetical protein
MLKFILVRSRRAVDKHLHMNIGNARVVSYQRSLEIVSKIRQVSTPWMTDTGFKYPDDSVMQTNARE